MAIKGQGSAQQWMQRVALPYDLNACLLWPFARSRKGYATFRGALGKTSAHREVCRLAHGEAPTSEHQAAHSCHNRACCNKRHLRWATPLENTADRVAGPNHLVGARVKSAKLTEDQARNIVGSEEPASVLAHLYGVSHRCVRSIRKGLSWPHLQTPTLADAAVNGLLAFGA